MQFGILGALEVRDHHDRVVTISGRQQRALLAMLVLNANHLVATEQLIPALWTTMPSGARHSLHLLVHRLRRALDAGGEDVLHTAEAVQRLHQDAVGELPRFQ
jgi:DNA-binding SARP family transcriptional activator